jgi:acyl carrier protein
MGATLDREALVRVILGHARAALDNPDLRSEDDFFEAGGDSILAVEMMDRLSETIGADIPVAFLYTYPTAEDMAGVVDEMHGNQDGTVALR